MASTLQSESESVPTRCQATRCSEPASFILERFGRRGLPTWFCWIHREEFRKLVRAQGKDWGRDRDFRDVRFHYGSRRGFHSG